MYDQHLINGAEAMVQLSPDGGATYPVTLPGPFSGTSPNTDNFRHNPMSLNLDDWTYTIAGRGR